MTPENQDQYSPFDEGGEAGLDCGAGLGCGAEEGIITAYSLTKYIA